MAESKSLELIDQRTGLHTCHHDVLVTRYSISDAGGVGGSAQFLAGIITDQDRLSLFRQIGLFRLKSQRRITRTTCTDCVDRGPRSANCTGIIQTGKRYFQIIRITTADHRTGSLRYSGIHLYCFSRSIRHRLFHVATTTFQDSRSQQTHDQ